MVNLKSITKLLSLEITYNTLVKVVINGNDQNQAVLGLESKLREFTNSFIIVKNPESKIN
jgi:phosphotransferase system HPr-like phosphotransfer protein